MRSIFTLVTLAVFFLITACSQTPVPETQTPTSVQTNTPLPTQTLAPSETPIPATSTPENPVDAWAKEAPGRAEFFANGGVVNLEEGIAYNVENGRVYYAKDAATGEWREIPNGMIVIQPGPGYEKEPPLEIPYYL